MPITTSQEITGEKMKCHIFRKSYGKDLHYGNIGGRKVPLNVIMKKLRHESLNTTSKYLKIANKDVKIWEANSNPDQIEI